MSQPSVVARFYVAEVTRACHSPGSVSSNVVLRACTNEQNKTWAQYTPSGEIKMSIRNELAVEVFADRLGEEFEITFTPIEPMAPRAA